MLCNYIFPFDPAHMFQNSPSTMTKDTRFLRLTMMKMIAEYSLSHDQTETNTNIIIDIDARGYIIGMEMPGNVPGGDGEFCRGRYIPLGQLTAKSWTKMCI